MREVLAIPTPTRRLCPSPGVPCTSHSHYLILCLSHTRPLTTRSHIRCSAIDLLSRHHHRRRFLCTYLYTLYCVGNTLIVIEESKKRKRPRRDMNREKYWELFNGVRAKIRNKEAKRTKSCCQPL